MSDNAIVVINERVGDTARASLVIIAMSDLHEQARFAEMAAGIQAFRDNHPGMPPILIVGNNGTWTTMQTDDPASARLADELREAVGIP